MKGIPASFSPIQLHNRLNRPVWIGFKRAHRDKRELVFLCAGGEGDAQVSKNFETFAGQIVREFRLDPEQVDFVELRCNGEEQQWYRWHAQWVGSAPMECRAELVAGESGRRYLDQALNRSIEAA
ncbi:hypothetical protein [Microbulbifer thermotolerans]|uniref:Uncharacterized protein n=1 Tax=Microbulbifer thermotolerans TaxID=252514 RepID=A0A143HKH3_MICTH|nr:hypothetical protein [Microbulbifer thermotolerans]AMX01970.1 hypothetical protein A3224_04670 [Microbulbifer thermotolerans]MCX2780531.1 hypothetical protein [Microbulbifer thermotolerans]MCX2783172.1 hypothetical protein [Microbulbifer thermotolerans]MCX2794226.1 hypothetical protein [Microbulbifer thermotolerans]MCX2800752.1 hypothetical protein [Microbulbifer thermotolerans]